MRSESFTLEPSGAMPNHPRWPVILHRGAVEGSGEAAAALEALFARNGWPPQWRNGIYAFDHYQTRGHEALGCARGSARVRLGGPDGREVEIGPGDVAVLPVGTGHRRLSASADFLVVGAYPPGQHADICRDPATAEMLARIRDLPAPGSDPACGTAGGASDLWRRD
jgi:uncharacterized protein YjlB